MCMQMCVYQYHAGLRKVDNVDIEGLVLHSVETADYYRSLRMHIGEGRNHYA